MQIRFYNRIYNAVLSAFSAMTQQMLTTLISLRCSDHDTYPPNFHEQNNEEKIRADLDKTFASDRQRRWGERVVRREFTKASQDYSQVQLAMWHVDIKRRRRDLEVRAETMRNVDIMKTDWMEERKRALTELSMRGKRIKQLKDQDAAERQNLKLLSDMIFAGFPLPDPLKFVSPFWQLARCFGNWLAVLAFVLWSLRLALRHFISWNVVTSD